MRHPAPVRNANFGIACRSQEVDLEAENRAVMMYVSDTRVVAKYFGSEHGKLSGLPYVTLAIGLKSESKAEARACRAAERSAGYSGARTSEVLFGWRGSRV